MVEGSRPDGVKYLSIYLIVSAVLGSGVYAASNRKDYPKIFWGSRARPMPKADNRTAICEPIGNVMWVPENLTFLQAFTACYKDSVTFYK
jgi:hypothetical protein